MLQVHVCMVYIRFAIQWRTYAVFFMKFHSNSTTHISLHPDPSLFTENYYTWHAVVACHPQMISQESFWLLFLSTWVVVSNICCIFNPIWGRFLFWLIFFKGFVSPPTSHPWFVSVAWVFFVYPGRPLGIRLLLLAKRKEAENTKLQHISPTIVRSLIYLLAISRIAMEMTISFL